MSIYELDDSSPKIDQLSDIPVILNCFIDQRSVAEATVFAISKDDAVNDEFFVSNTIGNADNVTANITHTKLSGDSYNFNVNFTTYEELV
jgi:hypothetical protein